MTQRQIYAPLNAPYYIWAPAYRETSGGVRVLHYLCHALNLIGEEAYVITSVINPQLRTPVLTEEVLRRHSATGRQPIAVYPEVITDNPLNLANVARYLLNTPGILTGAKIDLKASDLVFTHGVDVVPKGWTAPLLHVPPVDTRIFNAHGVKDDERSGSCFFFNRYLQEGGELLDVTADSTEISFRVPHRSLQELAALFRRSEVMYTYEQSTLCFEALLCGCPVVYLPNERFLPRFLTGYVGNSGMAWGASEEEITRAKATVHEVQSKYAQKEVEFWQQLDAFVTATQTRARQSAPLGDIVLPRERLAQLQSPLVNFGLGAPVPAVVEPTPQERRLSWLANRIPNVAQSKLIDQRLEAAEGGPKLLVVILDLQREMDKAGKTIASLTRQLYANVEILCVTGGKAPAGNAGDKLQFLQVGEADWLNQLNAKLLDATCDWFMLVDAGTEFTPFGLLATGLGAMDGPDLAVIYGDELHRDGERVIGPWLRPGLNLDLLLSYPAYLDRHLLISQPRFAESGGFDVSYTQMYQYEWLLRIVAQAGLGMVGHIEDVLLSAQIKAVDAATVAQRRDAVAAHLRQRDYDAEIETGLAPGSFHIRYNLPEQPLVSIIVPTKDQLPMLMRCVESVLEKTAYPHFELLIVDNNSKTDEALAYLAGLERLQSDKVRVLRYPHPFNFSAINNMAVGEARGEYLVLLNNDTAAVKTDWLDELLNHALRPEVGVVGAKLFYPSGTIQHAGVVLGLRGPADHPFIGQVAESSGYMDRILVDQNYSAVTAACMMVRKSLYEAVGGMDEDDFKVSYNDVDLCLKIGATGHLVVFTPHACMMHEGSVSQTKVDKTASDAKKKRFEGEQDALYRKWWHQIGNDPAYNRNLSLHGNGFETGGAPLTVWQPTPWRPLPVVLAYPGDAQGCGNYRVLQPFAAMEEALIVGGGVSWELFFPPDLARMEPDVIVFQRQTEAHQLEYLRRAKSASTAFCVFELDDYLPNVPLKSVHRSHIPKDVLKSLRKAVSLMDRFVLSTEKLADALSDLHQNTHVVHNYLPVQWWSDLKPLRRLGRKPRVGWAGGISHTGDLELIADIVKALANRVEWVFFGMCPDKLRPYIHEFHAGVPIEQYASKLASLNLDLALAPLEHNLFNECKSNLRLLEYGACGFPVVCTDIEPYRGNLPVTRVRNRYKDWMDAIDMHLTDIDASQRQADALRDAVSRDWMLSGNNLEKWRAAWLPD